MDVDDDGDPRDSDGRPLPYPNCPLCLGVGIIFSPYPDSMGEHHQTVCSCLRGRNPGPLAGEEGEGPGDDRPPGGGL